MELTKNEDSLKEIYDHLPEEQKANVQAGKMKDLGDWLSNNLENCKNNTALSVKLIRAFRKSEVCQETEALVESVEKIVTADIRDHKAKKKTERCLEYPGSKWSLAEWILSFFPEHHSYLEPFFGSGAILFTKERSNIETVNDLDYQIYNFFDWIRKDPERLAKYIYMTPYSRKEYEDSCKRKEEEDFEKAVTFCIRTNMGYGFRTNGQKVGWRNDVQGRERAYAAEYWKVLPERIMEAAERLRGVQIENRPAVDVIERFNHKNVLIYADPPYLMSARKQKQYKHEMSEEDHKNLLEALKAHKGPVILSGYDSKLYNDVLSGWHKESTKTYAQSATKRTDVLWMNFEPNGQMCFSDFPDLLPGKE